MAETRLVRLDERIVARVEVVAKKEDRTLKAQIERFIEAALNGKKAAR